MTDNEMTVTHTVRLPLPVLMSLKRLARKIDGVKGRRITVSSLISEAVRARYPQFYPEKESK